VLANPGIHVDIIKKTFISCVLALYSLINKNEGGDEMLPLFVPSTDLAKVLGITQRRVQQLENETVLIKNAEGKFELSKNIELYYTWKLQPSSNADYDIKKALHEKAKREKAEMINANIRNQLHDAEDVEQVMTNMLVNFRSKMLGLPSKIARKLVRQKSINVINHELEKAIKEALAELSEYDPAMFSSEIEGVEDEEENN
jgi:phage terminase Nu1 subunit (DNA packaging protein)